MVRSRTGKTIWGLRRLADLTEYQSSLPSTHRGDSQLPIAPASGDVMPSSDLQGSLQSQAGICICIYVYAQLQQNKY